MLEMPSGRNACKEYMLYICLEIRVTHEILIIIYYRKLRKLPFGNELTILAAINNNAPLRFVLLKSKYLFSLSDKFLSWLLPWALFSRAH